MSDFKRVTANGIDFAYLEAGPPDGPLALCLHGFPDHALTWHHLLPALAAAGYHAVAPWMRGYHPTGLAPDGNYELASIAVDAGALADALAGDASAVLIAHDWGAAAAYGASAYRPERFEKVVAMAVPPGATLIQAFLESPEQLKRSWYMFFFQHPLSDISVANNDLAFIDMLWRDWSPGLDVGPEFRKALKETLSAPGSLAAAMGYYRAMLGADPPQDPAYDDVRPFLGAPAKVPTLYLQGDHDGCIIDDIVDPAAVEATGVEYRLVEGAGHFLHLDQPDVVNRLVLDFLGR